MYRSSVSVCSDASPTQQLVEMRDEITRIIKLDDKFERKFSREINNTLERIARIVDYKREKLETRKRACFEPAWNWRKTNGDNYSQDDACEAADNVFLKFKEWIQLFTKNCRSGKHFQKQVEKLNKQRDRFFKNFANPVCNLHEKH